MGELFTKFIQPIIFDASFWVVIVAFAMSGKLAGQYQKAFNSLISGLIIMLVWIILGRTLWTLALEVIYEQGYSNDTMQLIFTGYGLVNSIVYGVALWLIIRAAFQDRETNSNTSSSTRDQGAVIR